MIKYSFIMPYYKRPELYITLSSYLYHYKDRGDIEIITVEDSKNRESQEDHNILEDIVKKYKDIFPIRIVSDPVESYNPATKYNTGSTYAKGNILILTSPEVVHCSNILAEIDKENLSYIYIVCACLAVKLFKKGNTFNDCTFTSVMWYQHSSYRNVKYHFCTAISKDNFTKVGGFNEVFSKGIGYEDDNFVKRVENYLTIIPRDDLLTYHIEHDRNYDISREEYMRLLEINKNIWIKQVRTNKF